MRTEGSYRTVKGTRFLPFRYTGGSKEFPMSVPESIL